MGLVDGEQRDLRPGAGVDEAVELQPLGRQVDELVAAGEHARDARPADVGLQRRGEVGRRHPSLVEGADLVLHQRDEGGDDERDAWQAGGGELIGEALAAAGGGDDEGLAAVEEGVDGLALPRTEIIEAEPIEQRGAERVARDLGVIVGHGDGGHHSITM